MTKTGGGINIFIAKKSNSQDYIYFKKVIRKIIKKKYICIKNICHSCKCEIYEMFRIVYILS